MTVRDRHLRAATVATALLTTFTLAATAGTASLLGTVDPARAAVQPGLVVRQAPVPSTPVAVAR